MAFVARPKCTQLLEIQWTHSMEIRWTQLEEIGWTQSEEILHKPNMGLTTWKNAPKGAIRKADVSIAKNFLSEEELSSLNRIVSMYLDYAELQAQQRKPVHMSDWIKKLDGFLEFNEQNILRNAGKVSHELAQDHAENEFEKYERDRRRIEATESYSDFDKAVVEKMKELESKQKGALPLAKKKRTKKTTGKQ